MAVFHKGDPVYCKKKDGREFLASYHYSCGTAHCVWAGGNSLFIIKPDEGEEIRFATPDEAKKVHDMIRATFDAMFNPPKKTETKPKFTVEEKTVKPAASVVVPKEEIMKTPIIFEKPTPKPMTDFELLTASVDAL